MRETLETDMIRMPLRSFQKVFALVTAALLIGFKARGHLARSKRIAMVVHVCSPA